MKVILFSLYGGKNRIAWRYPAPRHRTIIEPFAGSAGYACRYHDHDVILIEKDPRVAAALRYLVEASPADVLRLPILEAGDSLENHSGKISDDARAFISFWLNKGTTTGADSLSAWAVKYPKNTFFWSEKCRARAAFAASKVKHWRVIEGDFTAAPNEEATWFIDPPYVDTGHYYRCSSKEIDYNRLGEWCRERRGQAIVCEREGAKWLPFKSLCRIAGATKSGDGRRKSMEATWTSGKARR